MAFGTIPKATEVLDRLRDFFEPQLVALDLGVEQIEKQTLKELEQSLERINIALANPNSFGVYKVKMSTGGNVIISSGETNFEVGVLPILLERKKLILDRINLLRWDEKIESLRDSFKNVADERVRLKLEKQLTDLEEESQKWRKQSEELEIAQLQIQDKMQSELKRVEVFKLRSQVWLSILARESVGCHPESCVKEKE